MAKLTGFSFFQGFSGKLGNQLIIKRAGNRTILSACPQKAKKSLSEKQLDVQRRFKAATEYARMVIKDPVLSAQFKSRPGDGISVFNLAVADFYKKHKAYEKANPDFRCPLLDVL